MSHSPFMTAALVILTAAFAIADEKKEAEPSAELVAMRRAMTEVFRVRTDPDSHPYFPKGQEHYYTYYLFAMKEPSILHDHENHSTFRFRFTWLRSFNDPIAIRVWQEAGDYMIRAVRVTMKEHYTAGAVTHDITRKLTEAEQVELLKMIDVPSILKPLNEQETAAQSGGADGARWIFEASHGGRYGLLDYWSIKDYGMKKYREFGIDTSKIRDPAPFVKLALRLLAITNLTPPENDIY
jgi:hypothetical protein